jgi:endonuclease III
LAIEDLLDRLEAAYGRSRPYSRFEPMEELISCIMSQSSTDSTSFPAFTRLREAFPDWNDMERAGVEGILEHVRPSGLGPSKSKAIIGSLRMIRQRSGTHSLDFLREMGDLEARDWLSQLPGVGLKTASIVLCFAYGRPLIPVDTHVHRTSIRLGLIPPKASPTKAADLLLGSDAARHAFRFHTLLIQHGRLTCSARSPSCSACPVAELCPSSPTGIPPEPPTSRGGTKRGQASKP